MGKAAVVDLLPGMPLWRSLAGSKVSDLSLCCLVARPTFETSPRKKTPARNMSHDIRRICLLRKKPSNSVTASVCQWCVLDPQGAASTMHNGYKMYDLWLGSSDVQDVTFRSCPSLRCLEGKTGKRGGCVGSSILQVCALCFRVNSAPSPPCQDRLQGLLHSQSLRNCSFLNSLRKVRYVMRACVHSCSF